MLRSVCGLLFCLMLPVLAAGQDHVLRFDLGPQDSRTEGAWNHINRAETGGIVVPEAVDALGRRTAVLVRQIDAWSGVNRDGTRMKAPWPGMATRDSLYLGDRGDRRAALRFEHLKPHGIYRLVLFASRIGDKKSRTTLFRAGGKQELLNVQDNVIGTADLEDVQADGKGHLLLEALVPEGQTYGYLGVIELHGAVADAADLSEPLPDADGPPATTAQAWVIADGRTGRLLHGSFETTPFEIASTTKIMTAWIVLELADKDPELLDGVATVSDRADGVRGSTATLRAGDRLKVRDLLFGLLLPSGNDAAATLAEHVGGRLPVGPSGKQPLQRFVDEMNRRARILGMTQTRFLDPHGNSGNRASAQDLVRLTWTATQNPLFRPYVRTRVHRAAVMGHDGRSRALVWRNTNKLLATPGCDGVKTGTTRGAGACRVSSMHRDDEHLLVVVLGSTGNRARYVDTQNLIKWARRANAGGGR